jgi:large subunit ribosomal protein L3
MKKFILGKKLGMTTIYDEKAAQNVTLVECGAKVSLVRTEEKDKYQAVQLQIQKTKNKISLKEFRVEKTELVAGAELNISIFELGEKVSVTGISKAKGFQGVVKRHGFKVTENAWA